jgi:hypothetical protein
MSLNFAPLIRVKEEHHVIGVLYDYRLTSMRVNWKQYFFNKEYVSECIRKFIF